MNAQPAMKGFSAEPRYLADSAPTTKGGGSEMLADDLREACERRARLLSESPLARVEVGLSSMRSRPETRFMARVHAPSFAHTTFGPSPIRALQNLMEVQQFAQEECDRATDADYAELRMFGVPFRARPARKSEVAA